MIIGVDPHKSTHTATAVDGPRTQRLRRCGSLPARWAIGGCWAELSSAEQFGERRWAVENARGLGCHLAQWLVAHGETVLDASTVAPAGA